MLESGAEHCAFAEREDVLALALLIVAPSDALVANVLAEGVLGLLVLDHLALRPQDPRNHLRILMADLLLLKLLETPVLVHHPLGLRNGCLLNLPPLEETRPTGEVVPGFDHPLGEVELDKVRITSGLVGLFLLMEWRRLLRTTGEILRLLR